MAKLFVSYSRKDSIPSRIIILALKEMGHDVWVDWEDIPPASDWLEQIFRGIEGSDAFIFMVSPDSIISEVCTQEVKHAAKNNRRIIPVVLQPVTPQDTNEIIRKLNWIFLNEADDFTKGLERVKTAIELDFEWVEEHNRLQNRALVWERKKEPSLLLRGTDLWRVRQLMLMAEQNKKDPLLSPLQKSYVEFSNRNERRNFILAGLTILAILALAVLSYTAFIQRNEAVKNRAIADQKAAEAETNRLIAEQKSLEADASAKKAEANARKAIKEKQSAEKAQKRAEESRNLAAAQRSAALAQIYQIKPGELFTSTLLAIDSWQTVPSDTAEEILRKNISLLPIPVMQMSHAGAINAMTLNAEGNIFVTAGADGMVCAWQVMDGKKIFCVNSPGAITDAVITPDDQTVITGDDQGNLLFINIKDGSKEMPIPAGAPISDLDVQGGRDRRFVAVTTENNKIALINWKTRQKSGSDLQASGVIKFAVFSPNGFQIATGAEDGLITIWNLNQNNNSIDTRKHRSEIITLEFSPDGRFLVSGGADGAAVVLDPKTGNEVFRSLHSDQVRDIAFSHNGRWFVTASKDRYVRVWDTDTGKQLLIVSQSNAVQQVQVTENDDWITTTGDDKTVRIWNAITGTELVQIPLKGKGSELIFSKDDHYLMTGDQAGYVNIWDISHIPAPNNILQFDGVTASALYSPSGNLVAASDDKKIWVLNPKNLSTLTTRPSGSPALDLKSNIVRMVFSSKDRWVAALNTGNEVVLYNTQNRSGRTIVPANPVSGLAFSPDEKFLLTGDSAGNLQAWDVSTSKLSNTPVKFDGPITAMAATQNQLAIGANDQLHILDINTFQELEQPESKLDIELLTDSTDGTLLASSDSNGQIQIWHQENGKFTSPQSLTKGSVTSLAFTPTNNLLAIGVVDSLLLIDPVTLEEYARIPITGTVNSISFAPDGTTFMTSSLRVLQFWDLAKVQPIKKAGIVETACQHLIENLSQDQWDLFFKGDDYKPLCPDLSYQ